MKSVKEILKYIIIFVLAILVTYLLNVIILNSYNSLFGYDFEKYDFILTSIYSVIGLLGVCIYMLYKKSNK